MCIKLLSAIVVILCFMSVQSQLKVSFHLSPLSFGRTIFATDGINCHLFRSNYGLQIKNEKRLQANKQELFTTTWEDCRALCVNNCKEGKKPVCGEFAGLYVPFKSKCELRKAACLNGQAFIRVPRRKCDI